MEDDRTLVLSRAVGGAGAVTGSVLKTWQVGDEPPRQGASRLDALDAVVCDIGLLRSVNEDAVVRRPQAGVWGVADGMGGYQGGEWASAAVATAIDTAKFTGGFDADCGLLAQAIHGANQTIYTQAEARRARMGSTVVALMLEPRAFAVFWVGDSRAYRLRAGHLTQLTRDHTQVQERVDRGLLSPEQARAHPLGHVLTRAVGVQAAVNLDGARGEVEPGDRFLLCSDGLHGVVTAEEIAQALSAASPAMGCAVLFDLCRARGAPDNVTIVVVVMGGFLEH